MMLRAALMAASLLIGTVPPSNAHAPERKPAAVSKVERSKAEHERFSKATKQVSAFIRKVNREIVPARVEKLAVFIVEHSWEKRLDPMLVAAILAQESRFKPGLHVCHTRLDLAKGFTCDVGLGQVNWDTWGEKMSLDFRRLVTDDEYNISIATSLLMELRREHGKDPAWWAYYHDHREEKRAVYIELVTKRMPSIRPQVVARL